MAGPWGGQAVTVPPNAPRTRISRRRRSLRMGSTSLPAQRNSVARIARPRGTTTIAGPGRKMSATPHARTLKPATATATLRARRDHERAGAPLLDGAPLRRHAIALGRRRQLRPAVAAARGVAPAEPLAHRAFAQIRRRAQIELLDQIGNGREQAELPRTASDLLRDGRDGLAQSSTNLRVVPVPDECLHRKLRCRRLPSRPRHRDHANRRESARNPKITMQLPRSATPKLAK